MIPEYIQTILRDTQEIVYLYPFAMSWVWMFGGLLFYFLRERKRPLPEVAPPLTRKPMVSVLIPCHNEGELIDQTVASLADTNYPMDKFEVVAINDGSRDDTREKLDKLALIYPFLKVVHLKENKGKAIALKTGALMAKGEFLVCIDGDALLEPNSVAWLVYRLQSRPVIGAVTGNPRIRNRTTLLGKLQVGEFSTIIGLIKRTQMNYGKIFTVAGVVAAFRKEALHDVGYWSPDMLTDDIDITWNLQDNGWYVLYEPNALCWILMPETLSGLWGQRLRWAQGAAEVSLKYSVGFFSGIGKRMLPILFEYLLSVIWAHCVLITGIMGLITALAGGSVEFGLLGIMPSYWGFLLGVTFLLQSTVSMMLDLRYEPRIFRYMAWMIWYPLGYWLIMALTTCIGLYRAIFMGRKKLATWVSPDRGVGE